MSLLLCTFLFTGEKPRVREAIHFKELKQKFFHGTIFSLSTWQSIFRNIKSQSKKLNLFPMRKKKHKGYLMGKDKKPSHVLCCEFHLMDVEMILRNHK